MDSGANDLSKESDAKWDSQLEKRLVGFFKVTWILDFLLLPSERWCDQPDRSRSFRSAPTS
jgi:hypothetical protein